MRDQQPTRRSLPFGLIAGLSAIALISGGAVAWWTVQGNQMTQLPFTSSSTLQPSATPSVQAPTGQAVKVYWLKTAGDKVEIAAAPVTLNAEQPTQLLEGAFQQVLKQPNDPALASAIPANTQLRSLEVKGDGVHVDLSKTFTSGGGSSSMTGRLAQVVYTATTLDPAAPVWISVEGEPLDVLGGEGLLIDQPMTRASFEKNFQL